MGGGGGGVGDVYKENQLQNANVNKGFIHRLNLELPSYVGQLNNAGQNANEFEWIHTWQNVFRPCTWQFEPCFTAQQKSNNKSTAWMAWCKTVVGDFVG